TAGAGGRLGVDEYNTAGAIYCTNSAKEFMKNATECWKPIAGIVADATTQLSGNIFSISPKYTFAANPNNACSAQGFTCKGEALKADLIANYDFGLNFFWYKGRWKDSATLPLFEGFSFDCSL